MYERQLVLGKYLVHLKTIALTQVLYNIKRHAVKHKANNKITKNAMMWIKTSSGRVFNLYFIIQAVGRLQPRPTKTRSNMIRGIS